MNTILFLLTCGRMRAFIKQQSILQLKYRGASYMLCEDSTGLRDFVDYMVQEYAEAPMVRLFFCCDAPQALRSTLALLEEGCYPHYALASLSYCLPKFLQAQKVDNCWIRYENSTWHVSNGLLIPEESASGKCPLVLSHRQLAEMFFHEEKSTEKQKISQQMHPVRNQLVDYIEESKVSPRHHL